MSFSDVSAAERKERARRVDFELHITPFRAGIPNSKKYFEQNRTKVKERFREKLSIPYGLGRFMNAVVLIRENYMLWKEYIQNPSQCSPKAFESFVDDRLLVFYLFFGEFIGIFHLDPRHQFFMCDFPSCFIANESLVPSNQNYISRCIFPIREFSTQKLKQRNTCDISAFVKPLVKMYISLGSPMKNSFLDEYMASGESIDFSMNINPTLSYMYQFNMLSGSFYGLHFLSTKYKGTRRGWNDRVFFDVSAFVKEASIAIAFDRCGINTLKNIHKLFPLDPGLIDVISRKYIISAKMERLNSWNTSPQLAHEVVEEIFSCKISPNNISNSTQIHNQSLVAMMKKHPELYGEWSTDTVLFPFYFNAVVG